MSKALHMIEQFQCPGCVCGSDTQCGRFQLEDRYGACCTEHVVGTHLLGAGSFALGLPKGFNRLGFEPGLDGRHRNRINIRLWVRGSAPEWDRFNVAVWALEQDDHLFVRTYSPRTNNSFVDVVEGGVRAELCPGAIDVAAFLSEMD